MKVEISTFEEVLPIWATRLWPNRTTEIKSLSSIVYGGGYDMEIYKTDPVFYCALDGRQIVGVISGFQTSPTMFRSRGIWVDPTFAHKGIGRQLIMAVDEDARMSNCDYLWTIPRKTAMPFYERLGFKRTSDWFDQGMEFGPNAFAIRSVD